MESFHHAEQATNMSASGLTDRSSLPMGDNFHHPEHGPSMPSGGLSDRSSLPLGVEQDQSVQSWSTTASQDDVAADYSMFPATQPEGDYSSQQMTDIVHQTYIHSSLTQNDSYEGDHLRDMTRPQGLDVFSSRGISMSDSYEPRGSLNDQHPVEVYEPRGSLGDQHAMDLFQMKDVSQDSVSKGKDVPPVGRVMTDSRAQPSVKMGDHVTDSRHLGLSDIQDLRRVGISGIQTMCKPGVAEDSSQYAVLHMHYNNSRPNMEVTSASSMSDSRYQSLIDSMTLAQRVNESRSLSAANTSRHLLPALSPQYADERPPRAVNPQYSASHTNRSGRSVVSMDTYCTKGSGDMFQADKVDSQGADRNVALPQHRSVQRNSVDVFSDRSSSSFNQQIFEDSIRTSSSRTSNNNDNFVYAETSAPIVKARHLCFQDEENVQSKASGTSVSFSFVDNSVPLSKLSHQMYEDGLRTSQTSAVHSDFGGGMLSSSGSSKGSDVVLGRGEQEVLLTDKEWNHVTRLKLFHLMTNKKMCDVALKSGELRIEIHKVVLCAASDQLAMLLDSVDSDGFPVLSTSSQVSEGVLHAFAEFLYLGQVKITMDNISEMNTLASAFHIYALHDICLELIDKSGSAESNRLLDLKLTFESQGPPTVQRTDCGINTDDDVGLETSVEDDTKESPLSTNKTSSAGKNKGQGRVRGKGRSQGQGKSKSTTEEAKKPNLVERTDCVTHGYGTRGVVKKQLFEEGTSGENNSNKFNHKAAVKTPIQTAAKRKRVNSSKPASAESTCETTGKAESAAQNSDAKADDAGKPSESVAKAPVKPRHRSLKQKLMESVTEDTALDNPAMVNSNPLAKLMIVEENHAATGGWEDAADYTNLKGKKGKKARARKFLVPPHVQMTVRPPPKKRAKMELKRLKQEEEELGLSLSLLEDNIDDLPLTFVSEQNQDQEAKTSEKVTKSKRPQKQRRCRFAKTDIVGQLAMKLESLAGHIPFQLRQFKCDLCGNEFVFPKRSITHVINTHNMELSEVMSYVTIRERVEESPKVCDICGYKSKDANFYYIHIHKYFRHGIPLPKGWKPYTCDICGKELFTKFQLKDHRRIHFEETPFICQVCGQGFKSRTCLNSHVFHRHSDERKHQCSECSKSFKTRTQLMVHLRTHSGEKPYQCPECLYKSTTRGNMRLHLTNRHKLDPQTARSIMQQVSKAPEKATPDTEMKQGLEQDILENNQTFDITADQDTSGSVSSTTTSTTITLTDKTVLAEHAMHAILLPLAQGDNDGSSLSSQTIATYVVTGSVPLTGEIGEAITIGEPANQSSSLSITQQEQQCTSLNSSAQSHLYMQHSPISPPPQSISPQTTYVSSAHNVTSLSPVNLPANQQQGSALTTDDSIGSGSDAAIIQAYYQQQFYTHY